MFRPPIPHNWQPLRIYRLWYIFLYVGMVVMMFFVFRLMHHTAHEYHSESQGSAMYTNPLENALDQNLMPHLKYQTNSMKPVQMFKGFRYQVDLVIGITTEKRENGTTLIDTLIDLTDSLNEEERTNTLIIVMIAESDDDIVNDIMRDIVTMLTKHVYGGSIEVFSPSPYYYPDWNRTWDTELTLANADERQKWAKKNLDILYLLVWSQGRGRNLLLLEDDILTGNGYRKDVKNFITTATTSTPKWIMLKLRHIGGTQLMFKTSQLTHFIIYVQIFYGKMPMNALIENYLTTMACSNMISNSCLRKKKTICPDYFSSNFKPAGYKNSMTRKIRNLKIFPGVKTVQRLRKPVSEEM